jgi:hypothetical protein
MNNDYPTNLSLLEALKYLLEHGSITHGGICNNLKKLTNGTSYNTYRFVSNECVGWHNIKEPICYPIRPNIDFGLWEGPNLLKRQSLIKYLIKKLENNPSLADQYLK